MNDKQVLCEVQCLISGGILLYFQMFFCLQRYDISADPEDNKFVTQRLFKFIQYDVFLLIVSQSRKVRKE